MRKYLLYIIGLCITLLFACHKIEKPQYEITKVEFAHPWPAGAVSVDSALNYSYFGGESAKKQGYYRGKVTQAFWDTLNRKFESINYKQLDTVDNSGMHDNPSEIIIYWKGGHKRYIMKCIYKLPDSVANVYYWLANSFKRVKLHAVKDTIPFATTLQKPIFPPEKLKGVKFLPPKIDSL